MKLDWAFTYNEGLPPIKQHGPLNMCSFKSREKLKQLYFHYHSA